MSRSTSPVDIALAAHATSAGHPTSARQVERWRQSGLLPANQRRSTGRGSTSMAAEGAPELAVWLAQNARQGRRPLDLALQAFGEGLPVPEATVRKAFVAAVRRAQLAIERELPQNASPEDVADAAVRSGLAGTMLPVRVRKIDQALMTLGFDDLPSEIRDLDPDPHGDAVRPANWTFNTVLAMRAGGGELTVEQLGEMARSVMPPTLAAPYASDMERQWPENETERALLLNESGGLSLFPEGDIRELLTTEARNFTLAELRSGWQAAQQLSEWSADLCAAVEAELAAGGPGQAALHWMIGALLGPGRMFLTTGLRDVGGGPSDLAFTGLLLHWMRDCIRTARKLLPNGEFEHLSVPGVLPPCFLQLLIEAQILESSPKQ